jgi:hypothetical protein
MAADSGRFLLLDPEGGAAEILKHLDDSTRLRGRRQAQPRPRRNDHIFLPPDQHRPAVGAGGDGIAGSERRAPRRLDRAPAMLKLNVSGDLGHPPRRDRGESGLAAEEQHHDQCAQVHGRSPSTAAATARRPA